MSRYVAAVRRGDSIVEVWIFEANQYEVDELVGTE